MQSNCASSLVKANNGSEKDLLPKTFPLYFISHGLRSENLVLQVPKALTDEGKKDWGTTLVGYFIGKNILYSLVSSSTERLWSKFGPFVTMGSISLPFQARRLGMQC